MLKRGAPAARFRSSMYNPLDRLPVRSFRFNSEFDIMVLATTKASKLGRTNQCTLLFHNHRCLQKPDGLLVTSCECRHLNMFAILCSHMIVDPKGQAVTSPSTSTLDCSLIAVSLDLVATFVRDCSNLDGFAEKPMFVLPQWEVGSEFIVSRRMSHGRFVRKSPNHCSVFALFNVVAWPIPSNSTAHAQIVPDIGETEQEGPMTPFLRSTLMV